MEIDLHQTKSEKNTFLKTSDPSSDEETEKWETKKKSHISIMLSLFFKITNKTLSALSFSNIYTVHNIENLNIGVKYNLFLASFPNYRSSITRLAEP